MSNPDVDKYVRELDASLTGIPDAARQTILDDVRAHAADAIEAGRDPESVLAALGAPEAVARTAREELGLPPAAPAEPADPATRAGRILHGAALALAVVTAVFVTFLLPLYTTAQSVQSSNGFEQEVYATSTLFEQMGIGVGLLPLLPAALVLLPLVLPSRARAVAGWAVAGLVTAASLLAGFTIGGFYVPLALLLWAAMLVPIWMRGGRVWRIVGAVALLLPAMLAFGGLLTGTLQDASVPMWVTFFVVVLLAVLFAARVPLIDAVVGVLGVGVMLLGVFDSGMLLLALWWSGGLWLVVGLCGLVARGSIR
ncbi:MAG: hypothetical protein QM611_06685 [Microbacterium sp.]|uniref:HAAS signaling domain-containing protein n=1 Tax=Microbacterium sp. TaxID=51671 RepID=UPI0039E5C723